MHEMMHRLDLEMQTLSSDRAVCQGTLLSWGQYLNHIEQGDYEDARHSPRGSLTAGNIKFLTERFQEEQKGSKTPPAGSARREKRSEMSESAS
jgi:hypothetical protein